MGTPRLNIAIIGCGGITLQNHLPGIALCPETKVTALCDVDPAVLERARQQTGVAITSTDYREVMLREDVHAVIVATPNVSHPEIVLSAVAHRKHVLCEKPIALNAADAKKMADAAEQAGVRHMTAFTYRFVPAMRYLRHLVRRGDLGTPYHFRSCRLQDWGARGLGWRQVKSLAGSGELGDMLSHRIDFAHTFVGPMKRLVADTAQWHPFRGGKPNDLDDWVGIVASFRSGATGVLESSKMASGRNESWRSLDYAEINGSDASFIFRTGLWDRLETGKVGGPGLDTIMVPEEFWKLPGSPRDARQGDPLVTFRYDQAWEFVSAIREQRSCDATLYDGWKAQLVMDAALDSTAKRAWVEIAEY